MSQVHPLSLTVCPQGKICRSGVMVIRCAVSAPIFGEIFRMMNALWLLLFLSAPAICVMFIKAMTARLPRLAARFPQLWRFVRVCRVGDDGQSAEDNSLVKAALDTPGNGRVSGGRWRVAAARSCWRKLGYCRCAQRMGGYRGGRMCARCGGTQAASVGLRALGLMPFRRTNATKVSKMSRCAFRGGGAPW